MLKNTPEKHQDIAYIVQPAIKGADRDSSANGLEEAEGLVRAIDLKIAQTKIANVARIQAGAFLGKGQREIIGKEIEELEPDIVIFNHTLSPVQQRNLEREWKTKVIDRTGLILEIFGARAQTKEGRLQVELAALEYQKSRLVRSWTHLERQRGGAGFMGGPGETQIEIDRRLISQRITKLKKSLEDVRRTRGLARKSREKVPFPIIALAGYTNAGKSTLFNTLTKASVFAKDLLFATLDPTARKVKLSNKQQVIISDTVGFIADLPTHLIAAFRATLEQITDADVIAHVIDVSRPDYEQQRKDVIEILESLGVEYETDRRVLEVWNKVDAAAPEDLQDLKRKAKHASNIVLTSALKDVGMDDFLDLCADIIAHDRRRLEFTLPSADGKALAWLHAHGEVTDEDYRGAGLCIHVMLNQAEYNKFVHHFGYEPKKEK